ncbi:MAG: hypothetical protein ABSH41_03950 [Syntrophobacteraceae bacterium]|jgi:hypothetical protein
MAVPNPQSNVLPPGLNQGIVQTAMPANGTAGQSVLIGSDPTGRIFVTEEHCKPTFRVCAVAQTFYSTAAAVLVEIVGSATMTIRVKKILLWGQCATKFYAELTLGRSTTVSGSGSATALTAGKMDKNDAAATGVVNIYTAAATSGTGFAAFDARIMGISPPAAGMIAQPVVWDFCLNNDKPLILRGTGDLVEIYNNTTGLGAGTFGCMVEWEEDNS